MQAVHKIQAPPLFPKPFLGYIPFSDNLKHEKEPGPGLRSESRRNDATGLSLNLGGTRLGAQSNMPIASQLAMACLKLQQLTTCKWHTDSSFNTYQQSSCCRGMSHSYLTDISFAGPRFYDRSSMLCRHTPAGLGLMNMEAKAYPPCWKATGGMGDQPKKTQGNPTFVLQT